MSSKTDVDAGDAAATISAIGHLGHVLARQAESPVLRRLRGPGDQTVLSATDATSVEDLDARVRAWASSVWEWWSEHHATVSAALDATS